MSSKRASEMAGLPEREESSSKERRETSPEQVQQSTSQQRHTTPIDVGSMFTQLLEATDQIKNQLDARMNQMDTRMTQMDARMNQEVSCPALWNLSNY